MRGRIIFRLAFFPWDRRGGHVVTVAGRRRWRVRIAMLTLLPWWDVGEGGGSFVIAPVVGAGGAFVAGSFTGCGVGGSVVVRVVVRRD